MFWILGYYISTSLGMDEDRQIHVRYIKYELRDQKIAYAN